MTKKLNFVIYFYIFFRSFIRHVLFPSTHPPIEDGMYWQRCDGASNNNGHTTVDA